MRSKTTAALLALFLGGIGMHRFYLGRPISGVIYLLTCWTFIPMLLGFIECILLLVMPELAFQERYGTAAAVTRNTHVKCPDCRELIIKDARKCKHCGTALTPQ